MAELPRTGIQNRIVVTVREADTITFDGVPPVLSTPALIWHLEQTALQLVEPALASGAITVGTQIELEHTGPALIGDEIDCRATVVTTSDNEITFRVEATREGQPICRGLHRRKVVSVAQLRNRLMR